VNRPEILRLIETDLGRIAETARPRPLAIDPWLAWSLLQKAIRRGDVDLAERAAFTLRGYRGQGVWRRLILIAFEDVGIGSVDALIQTTTACTTPEWRSQLGGEEVALRAVVRLLAGAPKDRSPDHLIGAAHDHPRLEEARREIGAMSLAKRLELAADANSPLPIRAISAWYTSGVEWGKERRIDRGNLGDLMDMFRELRVPSDLVSATHSAAVRTRQPIVVMAPLLWLASEQAGGHQVVDCPIPPARLIGELPAYALDKHTGLGKAAIHRFARECSAVRDVLTTHVPEYRANDAACMAAFYADATAVGRRSSWEGSAELERLGTENDMLKVGVPPDGVLPVLKVVRDHLEQLNAIRAKVIGSRRHGR
jgi:hypothetical protein